MSNTKLLLSKFGIKPTACTHHTAKGPVKSFDEIFVSAFDKYCMNITFPMTKSQYNNIILYIKYADGELEAGTKEYQEMESLDKHLAKIGV